MSFASLFKSSTQEVSPNGSASNARSAAVLPIFLNKDAALQDGRSVDVRAKPLDLFRSAGVQQAFEVVIG